jgi:hypothetical protein
MASTVAKAVPKSTTSPALANPFKTSVAGNSIRTNSARKGVPHGLSTLEAKAHELLGQLDSSKLAAVVHLLEVMVSHEQEPVTEEDRRRFHQGQAWFAERGGKGIPMKEVLDEFGMKPEDFPLNK